jgi:uncharacterized protein (TIGR02145 family)
MKQTLKTCLAALVLLLAISCKKESSTIQSSSIAGNSSISDDITDINAPVKIGTQVWATKNLNVSRYRNGDRIPQVKSRAKWAALTTGAWCWYNNDSTIGAIYGKLYNWYAVHDPRGLAPTGWHIPSDSEWLTLEVFLGGYVVAGGKMKSTGTIKAGTGLWRTPNTDANNSSGFTGLPGGLRRPDLGTFDYIGNYGYWWSSTEIFKTISAQNRRLFYLSGSVTSDEISERFGFSVRCLRD